MRLTNRGVRAVLFCVCLWAAALIGGNAWAAVAACAGTLAIAVSAAILDRPKVRVERVLSHTQVVEGNVIEETFRIQNAGRKREVTLIESASPGVVSLDAATEVSVHLARHADSMHTLSWKAETWGAKRFGPLRILARDPLGLLEVETIEAGETVVRVEPNPAPLGKFAARASNPELSMGAHLVSKPGDSSDFFALRDYLPGDSIRRINWKASARSSKVIVNQSSRDTYARTLMLVDLREKETLGPHAGAAFVRNVRAVASLVAHHDRSHDHLSVLLIGDEAKPLSLDRNPRKRDILDGLIDCKPGGQKPFEAAVRDHITAIRPRSPVYFVTSAAIDPTLLDAVILVQALRAFPIVISPALPELDDPDGAFARSREATLEKIRALGVPTFDWKQGVSLEVTLAAQ